MRVRAQSASGDYTFGQSSANFLVNSPQAVAQLVITSLQLYQGEWYLNTSLGMPWKTQVLGFGTSSLYDAAVRNCILGVQGVTGISSYASSLNKSTRQLSITVTIQTQFGTATLSTTLSFAPPSAPVTGGYGVGGYSENPYGE